MSVTVTTLQQHVDDIISIASARELYDYTPDILRGLPIGNLSITTTTKSKSLEITDKIKKAEQVPTIQERNEIYDTLSGFYLSEKVFVREYLKALMASNKNASEFITNVYPRINVSDNIGLPTIGHTIDTQALDPEDWFPVALPQSEDRQMNGPAKLFPETTKYKMNPVLEVEMQDAYTNLHRQMYYNLYRDRYYTRNSLDAQFSDYPITRYGNQEHYGFKVFTTSHINMGDGASVGFSKKFLDPITEVGDIYDSEPEDVKAIVRYNRAFGVFIGYSEEVQNSLKIESKTTYTTPMYDYERDLQVEVVIDNNGGRYLLPSVQQDDKSVKPL